MSPFSQARLDTDLDWRFSHTRTYLCLYFHFVWLNHFVERDKALYTQNCDEARPYTKTAYMSAYILAKREELNHVLLFFFVFSM